MRFRRCAGLVRLFVLAGAATSLVMGCATSSPYDRGEFLASPKLRRSAVPLAAGTLFKVRQGAFGRSSHSEKGNEFSWDLEVPFGTPVVAPEDGVVIFVYRPRSGGGGCDPRFSGDAWSVQIENADRTVTQLVHVETSARLGQRVKKGQIIGKTVNRGWVCYPHVHFGIYRSRDTLYASPLRETVPLQFDGIPDGLLKESGAYVTP